MTPRDSMRVPVRVLREAFERSPLTASDVARELGWYCRSSPDSSRVKRTLGIIMETSNPNGSGRTRKFRKTTDIDTAERIGMAIGMEWWEIEEALEREARAA